MPSNDLEDKLAKKLAISIKKFDHKLKKLEKKIATEKASELDNSINSAIYEFDCAIKQKSSHLFINVFLLKKSINSHTNFNEYDALFAIRKAKFFGIKLPELEMDRDEKDRDVDEVEYSHPNLCFQLDAATTFGVLLILDDCISKEEFK